MLDKKFVEKIVDSAKKEKEDITLILTLPVSNDYTRDVETVKEGKKEVEEVSYSGSIGDENVVTITDPNSIEIGANSLLYTFEARNRVHTKIVAFAQIIQMGGSVKTAEGKRLAKEMSERMKKGKAGKEAKGKKVKKD